MTVGGRRCAAAGGNVDRCGARLTPAGPTGPALDARAARQGY